MSVKVALYPEKPLITSFSQLASRVEHKVWGEGSVMRYEGDKIVVLFEKVGYKTLAMSIVRERACLQSLKIPNKKFNT